MPELLAALDAFCQEPAGRITIDAIVTMLTWHDDNHLDQLRRALEGKA